jgi:hypothetical protein
MFGTLSTCQNHTEHGGAKGPITLQQSLYLGQLGSVVEFPKILGLLRQILPLDGRIPLVRYNLGSSVVEAGDQGGHVDI